MKRMKKIMALMLAAIMMMAMSVTAFAAEGAADGPGIFIFGHCQRLLFPSIQNDDNQRLSMTLSTRPYFTAFSAVMKLSRSVSLSMTSSGWPVISDSSLFIRPRINRI